jgi:hypothetical protein
VVAHCGEVRVVPVEIDNDTRKVRENVTVEVTEMRTAGGRVLPWRTVIHPEGPLTLQPCSRTKLEILVEIDCRAEGDRTADRPDAAEEKPAAGRRRAVKAEEQVAAVAVDRDTTADLDESLVGYFTVRLGGCVTRPIVVAVVALPLTCDSYRTHCSCSCC